MNYFKKLKQTQSGFTLIELLIVVAIIAILSGVVLASLNGARVKAKNAKIISEMSSLRAQAELFYNSNNYTYLTGGGAGCGSDMFISTLDGNVSKLYTSIDAATKNGTTSTTVCNVTPESWALSVTLPGTPTSTYCVDSTGASKSGSASTGVCI